MDYILAVDGGGTKTQFSISDRKGNQKAAFIAGCSNYKSTGVTETSTSLRHGLEQMRKTMGITEKDIAYSVWGISGCDSNHDYEILSDMIIKLGFAKEKFYLCNDGLLAYYAQAAGPGMVIIAGTGSIILGVDRNGNMKRSGGWGYNISDIGSGYWIGNEALKKTLLYCDGCCGYSPLYEKVRQLFGAGSFEELPYIITEITDYFAIAKVSLPVSKLGAEGEAVCEGIMREGANMLAALARSTYNRLGFCADTKFSIVFSGGVLKDEAYQKFVKEALGEVISLKQVDFFIQKNEPVYGGIQLAKQMLDKKCGQE